MTPQQKIKHLILIKAAEFDEERELPPIDASNVDELYQYLVDDDMQWDAANEVREGEVETGIKCEWSRHYESKAVAAQYVDGSWIGWTYWYGGGKHGEPEAVDWMDDAYSLTVREEEKVVTVRTFSRDAIVEPTGAA